MLKKSDLLKELGWDNQLIDHFMVDDSEVIEHCEPEAFVEFYDSSSMTITYNSQFIIPNLVRIKQS